MLGVCNVVVECVPAGQSELAGGHAGGSPPAYLSVFCERYLCFPPISRFPTHFPFGVICVFEAVVVVCLYWRQSAAYERR